MIYLDLIDLGDFSMYFYSVISNKSNVNSNVAIASFVTAYSRIHMSKFMNRDDITLLYTDTDSIVTLNNLDSREIHSTKLGFMKLESVFTNFVSIGPKSYIGVNADGSSICKLKGSKNKLNYLDFLSLLNEGSEMKLNHDKWFKHFGDSTISIKNTPFTLRANSNKRILVYSNGILIGTESIDIKYNIDK